MASGLLGTLPATGLIRPRTGWPDRSCWST